MVYKGKGDAANDQSDAGCMQGKQADTCRYVHVPIKQKGGGLLFVIISGELQLELHTDSSPDFAMA